MAAEHPFPLHDETAGGAEAMTRSRFGIIPKFFRVAASAAEAAGGAQIPLPRPRWIPSRVPTSGKSRRLLRATSDFSRPVPKVGSGAFLPTQAPFHHREEDGFQGFPLFRQLIGEAFASFEWYPRD